MKDQHRVQGLLLAMAGFGLLTVGDVIAKSMAGHWPGTAIATLRYCAGTLGLVAIISLARGAGGFSAPHPLLHVGRGLAVAVSSVCFFSSLAFMGVAEATVIQFTSPIITAILSAVFLKERAPKMVWLATAIALAGVVLVLRPNIAHLGYAAVLPVGAALGMSVMMILNRRVAGTASLLTMQFLISIWSLPPLFLLATLGHFTGMAFFEIGWPDGWTIAKCLFMAVSATTAHSLIFAGTQRASAALVAPATYAQLLVAVVLSWAVFNTVPDAMTWAGSALIVGAGLLLLRSQRA